MSVVDEPQVRIRLGQSGLKPQNFLVLTDCIIKPALLLCLLSSEKVFLNSILDL